MICKRKVFFNFPYTCYILFYTWLLPHDSRYFSTPALSCPGSKYHLCEIFLKNFLALPKDGKQQLDYIISNLLSFYHADHSERNLEPIFLNSSLNLNIVCLSELTLASNFTWKFQWMLWMPKSDQQWVGKLFAWWCDFYFSERCKNKLSNKIAIRPNI